MAVPASEKGNNMVATHSPSEPEQQGVISRREALKLLGRTALGVSVLAALVGCESETPEEQKPPTTKPTSDEAAQPPQERPPTARRARYRIVADECINCGACKDECPVGAIRETDGAHTIDAGTCTGCGACVDVCPVEAIREVTT